MLISWKTAHPKKIRRKNSPTKRALKSSWKTIFTSRIIKLFQMIKDFCLPIMWSNILFAAILFVNILFAAISIGLFLDKKITNNKFVIRFYVWNQYSWCS